MNISALDSLLINTILFLSGFIITLFVAREYRSRFSGIYFLCLYFLSNSIGVFLMYFFEQRFYIFSVVLSDILILLGGVFLLIGMLKFFKKNIPLKAISIIVIVISIILIYFTYIEYNYLLRSSILGAAFICLHSLVLYIIQKNRAKSDIEIISIVITILILSLLLRGIIPLFDGKIDSVLDTSGLAVLASIIAGISGAFISIGLPSLINSKLLDESVESINSFHNVIINSPLPLLIHTEDGEVLYVSDTFSQITGYSLEDVNTIDKWLNQAYDLERDYIKKIIKSLYKKPYTINDNISKVLMKDRKTRIWSFHSSYVGKYIDGRNMAMSVATDITEEQYINIEMKKLDIQNRKLLFANERAVKLADLLVWRKNYEEKSESGKIFVNERYAEVLGWERLENGMITDEQFYRSICEDDQKSFNELNNKRKKIHDNEINEYTLKDFKHRNAITNEEIYLNHHCRVEERYTDGRVKIIGGYNIDVTESRKNELILNFEREKAQTYLDIIGTVVVALDKQGKITLLNKKGCQLLGVSEEDVLGKNWFDLFIPKDIKEEMKKVFTSVFDNDLEFATQYENTVITKSGEKRIVNWNNSILLDIDKNICGVISSGEDVTDKRLYEEKLKIIGYKDALTGLHNRRYYEEELKRIDIKENLPITIAMGDINGLKLINDAFGHNSGDELLIEAAKVILEECRKSDIVARIGGDEFVIVMLKTNELEADKIISNIHKKSKTVRIESIELSISFGIKTKIDTEQSIQEIYRSAEDLMYREKLLEIPSMRSGAIETILNTLYEKDKKSEIHSRTVSLISEKIAKASGMSRQDIAETKTAGLLHDIGKIIISLSIINKEGKLTSSEYNIMKNHPEIGFRILNSTSDMRSISNIVLCHHERWDGSGYPRGIKAENIPVKARIITIADAYDAMTSERTYRDTFTKEEALKEIIANSGTQFDPKLVEIFEEYFEEITKI